MDDTYYKPSMAIVSTTILTPVAEYDYQDFQLNIRTIGTGVQIRRVYDNSMMYSSS